MRVTQDVLCFPLNFCSVIKHIEIGFIVQWNNFNFSPSPCAYSGIRTMMIKRLNIYSGAKKYLVSHQLCKFSHLKRWERSVIFIIRYTSTMRQNKKRKSHCRIFKEFICKLWWKISICSPTNKQDCWLSQTCNFFFKRLLCPPLVTCINGICLNSLSV